MRCAWSLIPFAAPQPSRDLRISGVISRQSNVFSISFQMDGNLSGIVLPDIAEPPARRNELWQETCFEFFVANLADTASSGYLEFNLSPSGHWNVYRFDDYRQGMRQETAVASLPLQVRREPGRLLLECECNLAAIGLADQALAVGISAVVRHRSGETTYWALAHRGEKPDFHRRDGFTVELNVDSTP
ncbi:MAG: DOMON-like domain-containing protein [Nitrospirae bacterium]|nr:DOMON-like domain-containing protein [Nitrospirota bacterium]